jgi:alcohol dehydrogenase YqhD (iron-dependent ADH family)
VAILDPTLTVTQPPRVTALTGIDAISHALETFVTTSRTPVSLAFSREAWRLLEGSFCRVLDDPADLEARANMQLGGGLCRRGDRKLDAGRRARAGQSAFSPVRRGPRAGRGADAAARDSL